MLTQGVENKFWHSRIFGLWHGGEHKMHIFWRTVFSHGPLQLFILYSSSPRLASLSHPCQWGMGYGALPACGSGKGEGQHTSLPRLLLAFGHHRQNVQFDEGSEDDVLPQGWLGWLEHVAHLEGGEEGRQWDAQNGNWVTCAQHCMKGCKQLELVSWWSWSL